MAFAALLAGAFAQAPLAATIYTWTDAQGVRHFSQYPPEDPGQSAETLTYTPAPPAQDSTERLQTIRDVARDLETSRQQREEQRAKASAPPPPAPPAPQPEPPVLFVPYPYGIPHPPPYPYPYPPPRPGPHPPKHDKPHKPDDKHAPQRDTGVQVAP
jgi:hypothetical protein